MRLIAALLVLIPLASYGQASAPLSWVNATKNTDNSTIPATGAGSLTRTAIDYGTCATGGAFGTKQGEIFVAAPANTATVSMVVIQQYCFRAWHTNTFGNTSGFSNVATKNNPAPTPGNPTGLTVAADTTAFVIVKSRDRVAMVPVGNVAPGTACDSAQPVMGKYVVPRASVTFVSSVQDEVVFAACG